MKNLNDNLEKICPNCGNKVVEIVYGFPPLEFIEKSLKEELYLGGCEIIIDVIQPGYHCYNCNLDFIEFNYKNDIVLFESNSLNNIDTLKISNEKNKETNVNVVNCDVVNNTEAKGFTKEKLDVLSKIIREIESKNS